MGEFKQREKLKELRKKKGVTRYRMAKDLGVNLSHYYRIEAGERGVSYGLAKKIKKYLDYYDDDLFDND